MTASERIREWRLDPVKFVRECFGIEPDKWQAKALQAFASEDEIARRISLQACAGPGKTAVLTWCGLNFLTCYGEIGHHPNAAAVSVTQDNLRDNLWKEFSVSMQRSEFHRQAFVWTKERIFAKDHPETWFISARSFPKKSNSEEQGRTLSGLHSKYILYLIDESGDINPAILKAAEQGLSNCSFGKIMQAGNPTSLEGVLHIAATKQRHLWTVIRISGDPDDPDRSNRIDIKWAREQISQYGKDDPWVKAYILGIFPPASMNALMGIEEVEEAMRRRVNPDQYDWAQKRLGIDVSRFGDDSTVIFPRQGLQAFTPVVMRFDATKDKPSVDIAHRAMMAKERWNYEQEYLDDTVGWAHGAIDVLRAAGHSPIGVNFASKKTYDPRYFNVRAEIILKLVDWIRRGGAIPHIPQLARELTTAQFSWVDGKYRVEEKDQIKKRLGFSTDYMDALALTFAQPEMPASLWPAGIPKPQAKVANDWDPYDSSRV